MRVNKTILIYQTDPKQNFLLAHWLGYLLKKDKCYFHFLYEPELIVRTDLKGTKIVRKFLKSKKAKFRIYDYPFPKDKKDFGENKKSVVYKYKDFFMLTLENQAILALSRKKKDDMQIIERQTHTFLNQLGYDVMEEFLIFMKLSYFRLGVRKRYFSTSLGETLYLTWLMFVVRTSHNMGRLLK